MNTGCFYDFSGRPHLLLAVQEGVILVVVEGMIQTVDPTGVDGDLQILKAV